MAALTLSYSCTESDTEDDDIKVTNPHPGDKEPEVETENPDYTYPTEVTITIDESLNPYEDAETGLQAIDLFIDDEADLAHLCTPAEIDIDKWSWDSSDHSVVNVDMTGHLLASSQGKAIVSVKYAGSNLREVTAEMVVNVVITSVEAITVTPEVNAKEVFAGSTLQLNATVEPTDATYLDVVWSSDYEWIASVDESGLVTGIIPGTGQEVTITATSTDGSGVSGSFSFQVVQEDPTAAIYIDAPCQNLTVAKSRATLQYTATVPGYSDMTEVVEWESSDESVVSIDKTTGLATLNGYGTATIKAINTLSFVSETTEITIPVGLFESLMTKSSDSFWVAGGNSGGGKWNPLGHYTVTTKDQATTNNFQQRGDLSFNSNFAGKLELNSAYPYFVMCVTDIEGEGLAKYTTPTAKKLNGTLLGKDGSKVTIKNRKPTVISMGNGIALFVWDLGNDIKSTDGTSDVLLNTNFGLTHADMEHVDHATNGTPLEPFKYNVYGIRTFASSTDYMNYDWSVPAE